LLCIFNNYYPFGGIRAGYAPILCGKLRFQSRCNHRLHAAADVDDFIIIARMGDE
jgi:hypothetical protein